MLDDVLTAYICKDCMNIQRESEKCKCCGGSMTALEYEDATDEEDGEQ